VVSRSPNLVARRRYSSLSGAGRSDLRMRKGFLHFSANCLVQGRISIFNQSGTRFVFAFREVPRYRASLTPRTTSHRTQPRFGVATPVLAIVTAITSRTIRHSQPEASVENSEGYEYGRVSDRDFHQRRYWAQPNFPTLTNCHDVLRACDGRVRWRSDSIGFCLAARESCRLLCACHAVVT
jgi:hypothetical protein